MFPRFLGVLYLETPPATLKGTRNVPTLIITIELNDFKNPPKRARWALIQAHLFIGGPRPAPFNGYSCPGYTKLSIWFQPWNWWGLCSEVDVGPPLSTLLQLEMLTYGAKSGWCDQPFAQVEVAHGRKCWFRNGVWWAKIKECWPWHVPNFEELGFKVGSSFLGWNRSFPAEPVQVRFTPQLRNQRSMWMQDDGCKFYMDSYMTSNGSCFMVTWIISKKTISWR